MTACLSVCLNERMTNYLTYLQKALPVVKVSFKDFRMKLGSESVETNVDQCRQINVLHDTCLYCFQQYLSRSFCLSVCLSI